MLHYAKGLGQAAADGAPIVDVVITVSSRWHWQALHCCKQMAIRPEQPTTPVFCTTTSATELHMQVPAWFGQAQRQALLDAAGLAGLNVLSLVNSHAAAALQYGIERNFANKSEHVLFYDVGSSSTQVWLCDLCFASASEWQPGRHHRALHLGITQCCLAVCFCCDTHAVTNSSDSRQHLPGSQAALVQFSSFDIKEAGKVNTYSQFETVDTAAGDDSMQQLCQCLECRCTLPAAGVLRLLVHSESCTIWPCHGQG